MQVLTNFRSRYVSVLNLATAKAGFLILLTVVAGTPNLRAESQCDTPYEYNCTFTLGGGSPCGSGTYKLYLADNTPGSMIYVEIYADGEYRGNTQVPGDGSEYVSVSVSAFTEGGYGCVWPSLTGTMYAYEAGYTDSNTADLSF